MSKHEETEKNSSNQQLIHNQILQTYIKHPKCIEMKKEKNL